MSNQVEVSVIVAGRNVEAYIERAVSSALQQEGVALEVVVVDDCSTDRTVELVKQMADPRLRLIQLPQNLGPSGARNAGIAAATGQWLAVLDGDDAYAPGRLKRMLDIVKAKQADIVIDNLLVVPEPSGDSFPMFNPASFGKMDAITLPMLITSSVATSGSYPLHCSKPIFSAAFLANHKVAYKQEIRIGEDYLIFAEALAQGAKCVTDPEFGYLYTRRAGSISHRIGTQAWDIMLACDRDFEAKYPLQGEAQKAQRTRVAFMREMRAYQAAVEALKSKSIGGFVAAIVSCPLALRRFAEPVLKRVKRLFG